MTADVVTLLLLAGVCDVAPCDPLEITEKAWLVQEACGDLPAARPHGDECRRILIALWHKETGGTLTLWLSGVWTGSGQGPLQMVQPWDCYSNTRIRRVCIPTHELWVPETALKHAVWLLRLKWARSRSPGRAIEAYNGTPDAPSYRRAVEKVLRRMDDVSERDVL